MHMTLIAISVSGLKASVKTAQKMESGLNGMNVVLVTLKMPEGID
jgi:hypothetical protein